MKNLFKNKIVYIYIISVIFVISAFMLGIMLGAVDVELCDFFDFMLESPEARIIYYVRLPRVTASLFCGCALAVAGALIQGVLANKLASPSIIGVNSGAALAVTVCSSLGIVGGWQTSLFAFLGAISDSITTLMPDINIMSNDFKIGDFSAITYTRLVPAVILIFISLVIAFTLSNELDIMVIGDDNAKGLGMNTELMRVIFLVLVALLAASAVSLCGLLSFVGLLVPHMVRRLSGTKSKHLLPLCALIGGGFVSVCDTLSRLIFAPYEIPVGIIMAFLGAPFFIYIIVRREKNA